jgi:hypothetical protein
MKDSVFSILHTYKPTESVNPEENYLTKLLVYLLNYSLKNETDLFKIIMTFLGEKIDRSDYKASKISTQNIFYAKNNDKAIPDITGNIHSWGLP